MGQESLSCGSGSWSREWQVGFALSQQFAWFTPYVGGKCAKMRLQLTNLQSLGSLCVENKSPFGVFVGLGVSGIKGVFFDGEVSFLDDSAFSCALGLRF